VASSNKQSAKTLDDRNGIPEVTVIIGNKDKED
jgi:hypothetical protein